MLNGTLVLRLPLAQVGQLLEYCTAYRSYLWQATLPTPERNQLIRQVQSVQARLERARAGGQQESEVWMSEQEKQALREVLSGLTWLWTQAAGSRQREQRLSEIAGLRVLLERACRQTCRAERREEWQDDLFRIGRH